MDRKLTHQAMNKPNKRKPRGYWQDLTNLERELKAFAVQHGLGNTMPTKSQLAQAHRYDLWNTIFLHGGLVAVAQQFSLSGAKGCRPRGYWQDFGKLKEELLDFMANQGLGETLPTCSQLIKAQRADLLRPIVL